MLLLLSGRSGPGRGSPGSGRCGHSWRGRRVSKAVSWKATASASTASMPPATSISTTPNDQPGAPTLTLVTAARLRMCWTAWAAATTVDPRTGRRVGATVLVQDDDGGRGVDGDPENLGVDDPVQVLLAGAELGGERPLGPADRAEGAEPAGGPSPRHAEGPRATVGVRGKPHRHPRLLPLGGQVLQGHREGRRGGPRPGGVAAREPRWQLVLL